MGSTDLQSAALPTFRLPRDGEPCFVPQAHSREPRVPARGTVPPAPASIRAVTGTVSLIRIHTPAATTATKRTVLAGNATADVHILLRQLTFPPPAATPAGVDIASDDRPQINPRRILAAATVIATSGAQTADGAQSPDRNSTPRTRPRLLPRPALRARLQPQQTLQQLDRVLQQLGIDPQTLSLISREGMLNWVNDPAALRQIVQRAVAANPRRIATGAKPAVIAACQINRRKRKITASLSSTQHAGQRRARMLLTQNPATAQQNAIAAMQFQKLQDSLAPSGIQQAQPAANPGGTTTQQAQLLNVSA